MISITELYRAQDLVLIDRDSMLNLEQLHFRLNFLRRLSPFPWIINRGFSTVAEQILIYQKLGQAPKLGSEHLFGNAADIADPKGDLKRLILDYMELIEGLFLFLEDFDHTASWVHIQQVPYKSWVPGKSHFFIP